MSRDELEDLVVDIYCELVGDRAGEVRAERAELGSGLAIDSVLAVEMLVRLEERLDVELPDEGLEASLRQLGLFVEAVWASVESTQEAVS